MNRYSSYPQISFTHLEYVILTESVLFLENMNRETFSKSSPENFLKNVYLDSHRCDWCCRKMDVRGPDRCKIMYIVNDRSSYDAVIKNLYTDLLDKIAEGVSGFEMLKGPQEKILSEEKKNITFLTDCVLCQNICSILHPLPGTKLLSSLWGFCTECYVNM